MKRFAWVLLLLLAAGCPAPAGEPPVIEQAQLRMEVRTSVVVGEVTMALELVDSALREQPDDAGLLSLRAWVRLERDEYDAALADVRGALAREPGRGGAHHVLGSVLQKQGDLPGAIAALASAAHFEPKNAHHHLDLAASRFRAGEVEPALAAVTRAVEVASDPDLRCAGLRSRASMRAETGDLAGAVADYREAMQIDTLWEHSAVIIAALGGGIADLEEQPLDLTRTRDAHSLAAAYFLGNRSLEETLREAGKEGTLRDPADSAWQQAVLRCRTNVLVALWLERKEKETARRLYAEALGLEPRLRGSCADELRLAKARLARLPE